MSTVLWTVIPYAALTSFVAGHVWRWRHDRWEMGRRRHRRAVGRGARWDIRLVHLGVVAMLVDVISLLIPRPAGSTGSALRAPGLAIGVVGATATTIGLVLICARGLNDSTGKRRAPQPIDWLTFALLFTVLSFGLWEAVGINAILVPHDNGLTIGRWLRDLLTLHPDPRSIDASTVDDRWHVATIVVLVGLWPYTRLVHAWHGVARLWLQHSARSLHHRASPHSTLDSGASFDRTTPVGEKTSSMI